MNDNKKQKNVFSRIGSSFVGLFNRMFAFGKRKEELFESDVILSPRELAVQNFKRDKLAMTGLILFIVMTLVILIGSSIVPLDKGTEPVMRNLAPGRNYLKVPKGLKNNGIQEISSGISFSIGLDDNGKVYVWGSKAEGIKKVPAEVKDAVVTDVVAGDRHALVLTDDNKIYAWGLNSFKQAEVPDTLKNVFMLQKPVKLFAGDTYSAVLTNKNELKVWGSTMSTGLDIIPSRVQGHIVDASASAFNMILLLDDGTIESIGQKGTQLDALPTHLTDGSTKIVQVVASQNNGLALDDQGKLHAWGESGGNALNVAPAELENVKISQISNGRFNFTAISEEGKLFTWGSDKFGQATLPSGADAKTFVGVDSSFYENFAYDTDGNVVAWGNEGFLFGSDDYGRDIGNRLLHGGRITMFVGAIAVLISTIIGVIVGLISGFYGGWVDNLLMRIAEIINSFPFLPLAITLSTIMSGMLTQSQKLMMIMVILGVLSWPSLARLVRGQILAEREKDFVLAARALGLSNKSIILKHILPSVVNIIIVSMTLSYAGTLLTESGLSFLGFGVALPQPSWGNMLIGAQDSRVIEVYWWRWVFPAVAVLLAALSVNLVGDGLREALDPKSNEK